METRHPHITANDNALDRDLRDIEALAIVLGVFTLLLGVAAWVAL